MSFFDEDDEPRTRVRPRRAAPHRGAAALPGPSDRAHPPGRAVRRLPARRSCCSIFVVNGCRESAQESALKDYNRDVASIVRDSDSQVGKPFFDLLRNPSQGDLSTQIAGYKVQADQQYQQAKRIDTPGDMTAAQRSFLIAMEMRRDGLQSIADQIRTALSSDAEAADKAIEQIAGAMSLFLSSDVVYTARVLPADRADAAATPTSARSSSSGRAFLPGVEWLDPERRRRRARPAALRRRRGGSGREPAPGLHGTGIDSVQVGDQTLTPDAAEPDRLRRRHRVHRQLHQPGRERRGRHRRRAQDRGRARSRSA